jgi:hypothetical protein
MVAAVVNRADLRSRKWLMSDVRRCVLGISNGICGGGNLRERTQFFYDATRGLVDVTLLGWGWTGIWPRCFPAFRLLTVGRFLTQPSDSLPFRR